MRETSHSLLLEPGDQYAIDDENKAWVRKGDEFYLATIKAADWGGYGSLPLGPEVYKDRDLPKGLDWWICLS